MSGRLNYEPYDVIGASVSALFPDASNYEQTAADMFGVDDPAGQVIVGIGDDYPDVVFTGTRDQLISVFREALMRLGS